jgi:hypothetical protein
MDGGRAAIRADELRERREAAVARAQQACLHSLALRPQFWGILQEARRARATRKGAIYQWVRPTAR